MHRIAIQDNVIVAGNIVRANRKRESFAEKSKEFTVDIKMCLGKK